MPASIKPWNESAGSGGKIGDEIDGYSIIIEEKLTVVKALSSQIPEGVYVYNNHT